MTAPTYTSTSTIPRNSASSSSQMTALLKKHSTSSNAEYTGIARQDDAERGRDQHGGEYEKKNGRKHQRYRASAARSAAIMAS